MATSRRRPQSRRLADAVAAAVALMSIAGLSVLFGFVVFVWWAA